LIAFGFASPLVDENTNPSIPISFKKEFDRIALTLERNQFAMQLKLFNATPNDFKEVCELKPRILHLSMHGGLESNKLKILREKCRASFGKNFITTK
jgi:hypothetical protein